MTDRHAGYLVILEHDIREDDAEAIVNALRMVRGVVSVEPIINNIGIQLAMGRARAEIREKALRFVDDLFDQRTPKEEQR